MLSDPVVRSSPALRPNATLRLPVLRYSAAVVAARLAGAHPQLDHCDHAAPRRGAHQPRERRSYSSTEPNARTPSGRRTGASTAAMTRLRPAALAA